MFRVVLRLSTSSQATSTPAVTLAPPGLRIVAWALAWTVKAAVDLGVDAALAEAVAHLVALHHAGPAR